MQNLLSINYYQSSGSSQEIKLELTSKAKGKRQRGNVVPSPIVSALSQSIISPKDITDKPPNSSFT